MIPSVSIEPCFESFGIITGARINFDVSLMIIVIHLIVHTGEEEGGRLKIIYGCRLQSIADILLRDNLRDMTKIWNLDSWREAK